MKMNDQSSVVARLIAARFLPMEHRKRPVYPNITQVKLLLTSHIKIS